MSDEAQEPRQSSASHETAPPLPPIGQRAAPDGAPKVEPTEARTELPIKDAIVEISARLTGIEITDYRGYRGRFRLDFPRGENIIVYGENGAGKSSLYHALKIFMEADPDKSISNYVHRFVAGKPGVK